MKDWRKKRSAKDPEFLEFINRWPDKFWYAIKYRYNLTIQEFKEMYERQEGRCASCLSLSSLVIDHNHKTNKVRSLICYRCNAIAGAIEDERYEAVRKYLAAYLNP